MPDTASAIPVSINEKRIAAGMDPIGPYLSRSAFVTASDVDRADHDANPLNRAG